jgi:hypothetical protein
MISLSARAATTLRACPELWPSPWPGAPSISGSLAKATPGYCEAWSAVPSMSLPSAMTGPPEPWVQVADPAGGQAGHAALHR